MFKILQLFFAIITMAAAFTHFPDPDRAARVSNRWKQVQAIPVNERTLERLVPICGTWTSRPPPICRAFTPGRPNDVESNDCDAFCCHQGRLTGFCTATGCSCTDDGKDALCGRDGSVLGIRCPDRSACKRKCCRQQFPNYNGGGRCAGFLGLKCKC